MSNLLEEYYGKYPIYRKVKFSFDNCQKGEVLHPIFVMTQKIIDGFIETGSKRIAIVLPDDDCNIMPLVISKYFSNVQKNDAEYAGSVLDDITSGQHLMLGKAVVEFVGIDREKNRIKFNVERKNKATVTCPINGIHYMFEKTERELSTLKTWFAERKEAEERLEYSNRLISTLKTKRTVLKKTLIVLSAKNDFIESAERLFINGTKFSDAVSYGEIDLSEDCGFKLYNKGKLDCIPGIAVTAKIDELKLLLKNEKYLAKTAAVFVDNNKFDEIIDNQDTLKYVLKKSVPLIIFVPESKFELYPFLNGLGFDFWHWKPSTIKIIPEQEVPEGNSVFGHLNSKVNHAISSEFSSLAVKQPLLRQTLYTISRLSQITVNFDLTERKLVRKLWSFQNKLSGLLCGLTDSAEKLNCELTTLKNDWEEIRELYKGQEIESLFNLVFKNFTELISVDKPLKLNRLEDYLSQPQNINCNVTVLVPNDYAFFAETYAALSNIDFGGAIRLLKLKSFYEEVDRNCDGSELLIVTWFDKDEYIRIKQTYCYKKLVYLLYDFENKWRNKFVSRVDECLPHESVKASAVKINIPVENIGERPFDKVNEIADDKEFDEISDYNISHNIIRLTIGGGGKYTADMPDTVVCIPVIFEGNKVGYFYPEHDIINVSALIRGDVNRPVKKSASSLKKGDNILIRQSGRDIIREKADWLMETAGEKEVRELSELWSVLLQTYASGKSISEVCRLLNAENADCTFQQVRYWLSGETILPRDKNVLIAIAKCVSKAQLLADTSKPLVDLVDVIFDAGRKVQAYHQKAGRLLTSELKNKAEDIKTLFKGDTPYGTIEGIGEVYIYTVEDVLDKELIDRGKLNRIEDL